VNERDRTHLGHIRDRIAAIRDYTVDGELAFLGSRLHQDAVIRNFEIIGEAGSRLSAEVKSCGDIPWAEVKAFRNFIAHQYEDVRPSLVWQVIVKDLPSLEAHVKALLAS
jgi:uncharacterized protein with HEPN domain